MSEPLPALSPGMVLSGRYRLESHLGAGATSSVWRARDLELGRVVALKALLGSDVEPALAARFEREGAILARLSHPAVVPIFASGADAGRPYLVMELIDGVSFDQILTEGPLPVDDALDTLAAVAGGLGAAHRAGIIHRDVKPANIVCHRDGTPRLVDFGIARDSDLGATTTANVVLGTASYLSPEQATGEALGPASDVYSLGCVLYEALTGRPPHQAPTALAVAHAQVHDEPVPPGELRSDLPVAVNDLVLRALAKSPAARYPSAAEFEADLRRVRRGEPPLPSEEPATVAMAALAGSPGDTMPLPAIDPAPELVDSSPLAARATAGARRRGIAAAVAGGAILIGLALGAGTSGDDGAPPAGATDDRSASTTVATAEIAPPEAPAGPERDEEKDEGKNKGKGKGKGRGADDDDDDDD